MNKNKYIARISSLLMAMVVLSMFVVCPAMACKPEASCGDGAVVSDPIELKGKERQAFLDEALNDEDLVKSNEQLKDKGYKQKGVDVYELEITPEEGSPVTVNVASFKYETANGKTEELHYIYNVDSGEVVILSGPLSCVSCLGAIVFGGSTCAGVCVVSGALSMGATCVGCILLAGGIALCPCYDCACAAGFDDACEMSDILC